MQYLSGEEVLNGDVLCLIAEENVYYSQEFTVFHVNDDTESVDVATGLHSFHNYPVNKFKFLKRGRSYFTDRVSALLMPHLDGVHGFYVQTLLHMIPYIDDDGVEELFKRLISFKDKL